jgi:hypothetical protein
VGGAQGVVNVRMVGEGDEWVSENKSNRKGWTGASSSQEEWVAGVSKQLGDMG